MLPLPTGEWKINLAIALMGRPKISIRMRKVHLTRAMHSPFATGVATPLPVNRIMQTKKPQKGSNELTQLLTSMGATIFQQSNNELELRRGAPGR